MRGIYYYIDKKNGEIVYIGKDSYIDKDKRHKQHMSTSYYNNQQNNPNRYDYDVLIKGDISEKLLNGFEMAFIRKYSPRFNFTDGGEGLSGFAHSEETKRKMSEVKKGENNHNYGKPSPKKKNYFRIVKAGFHREKQRYGIKKDGKFIKVSINRSNLVDWFIKEYPKQILVLIENGGCL